MRSAWFVGVFVAACGGGKDAAAPAVGSGSAMTTKGSAAAPVPASPLADAGAGAGSSSAARLELDHAPDNGNAAFEFVFPDKTAPKLPAISGDGTTIAEWDMFGPNSHRLEITFARIGEADEPRTEALVDPDMAAQIVAVGPGEPTPPAVEQEAKKRAAALMKELRDGGYTTLVDVEQASRKPPRVGDVTFVVEARDTPHTTGDTLDMRLVDATGKVIAKERFVGVKQGVSQGPDQSPCSYVPQIGGTYRDAASRTFYGDVYYQNFQNCLEMNGQWLVWELPPRSPASAERAAIAEALDHHFEILQDPRPSKDAYRPDAQVISKHGIGSPSEPKLGMVTRDHFRTDYEERGALIEIARDGQTAWAHSTDMSAAVWARRKDWNPWRISFVLVKTAGSWRIAAAMWSEPLANDVANAQAKAGKLVTPELGGDPGDAELNAAFAKLATDGVANAADELVALGSAPGERSVGGAAFAKPWNAAWKGHATVAASIARLAPSKTTGWVVARLELQKTHYKVPFLVFAVFDKSASGWSLVHVHFAVARA
jgi:hypothetical protein